MLKISKGEWRALDDFVLDEQGTTIFAPCPSLRSFVEGLANAQLGAAAPDMYEALKIAEARVHNEIRRHPEAGDYRKILQDELREITQALDKAEGVSC